jgi:2-polyprenyl-3-methyl-5-hydroxy-6-metoxy-1,4-benzoquinol methylase
VTLRLILCGEAPADLQTQLLIPLGHIWTNDGNQSKNLSWNRQVILLERTHLKLQDATLLSSMDQLRKRHNQAKRDLITQWVKPGSYVLDCGCGRGGDWHKWKTVRARVAAIDPDEKSLLEAEERAMDIGFGVWFLGTGDIRQAAFAGPYDVVCYNFSIQYILGEHFEQSIKAIKLAAKPGGLLIGITPEKSFIESAKSPDALGNVFEIHGDKVLMSLTEGPFYADGPKYEPLLDGNVLRQALEPEFRCVAWGPIAPEHTGLVTDIYAQFVFLRLDQ